MCGVCGCSDHPPHARREQEAISRVVQLEEQLFRKNDQLAERLRGWFVGRGLVAINLLSSPGSGKTTLLERTLRDRSSDSSLVVIQGDQATDHDARRIRDAGARAFQVNTGAGCHLDASMVARALGELSPEPGTLVVIENVGNLVCPAMFDLGEQARVTILSVTEGADKPSKYPHAFRDASLVLLNKIDLLPYVDFDLAHFERHLREVNPHAPWLRVSAKTGEGLPAFYDWLASLTRSRSVVELAVSSAPPFVATQS